MSPEKLSDTANNEGVGNVISETEFAKEFYALVDAEMNTIKMTNDPKLPEDLRALLLKGLNDMRGLLDRRYQQLGILDREELKKEASRGEKTLSSIASEEPEGDSVFVQPDGTIITKSEYGGFDRDDQGNNAFGRGN